MTEEERLNQYKEGKTPLQGVVADLFFGLGVSVEFMEASDHKSGCRCDKCLNWWAKMWNEHEPEETGPFTFEEIKSRQEEMSD